MMCAYFCGFSLDYSAAVVSTSASDGLGRLDDSSSYCVDGTLNLIHSHVLLADSALELIRILVPSSHCGRSALLS